MNAALLIGFGSALAVVVLVGVAGLFRDYLRDRQLEAWHAAALAQGVSFIRLGDGERLAWAGSAGDLGVHLETMDSDTSSGTRLVITGIGGPGGRLSIRGEGLGTAVARRLAGSREVELGDADFDREFFIQGPTALVFATLDWQTRREVASFLRGQLPLDGGRLLGAKGSLANGELCLELPRRFWRSPGPVELLLAGGLRLARLLLPPANIARRLAQNLASERQAGVRRRLVAVLAREYRHDPATREALRAALGDRDELVRLQAAIELDAEGRDMLRSLAGGAGIGDGCRAAAVRALGADAGPELAENALRDALERGQPLTSAACLERLRVLRRREAEGLVLQALACELDGVRLVAARALRSCGSPRAVAPLLEAARTAHANDLRQAARASVGAIQSRLSDAGAGRLSIADEGTGALTLAETDAAGRLSLPEEGSAVARPTANRERRGQRE